MLPLRRERAGRLAITERPWAASPCPTIGSTGSSRYKRPPQRQHRCTTGGPPWHARTASACRPGPRFDGLQPFGVRCRGVTRRSDPTLSTSATDHPPGDAPSPSIGRVAHVDDEAALAVRARPIGTSGRCRVFDMSTRSGQPRPRTGRDNRRSERVWASSWVRVSAPEQAFGRVVVRGRHRWCRLRSSAGKSPLWLRPPMGITGLGSGVGGRSTRPATVLSAAMGAPDRRRCNGARGGRGSGRLLATRQFRSTG